MTVLILLILATVKSQVIRDFNGDIFTECQICAENSEKQNDCKCQCLGKYSIFRDDTNECVNHLKECPLLSFVRPFISEQIPVVSLPLNNGQLIHPHAHLALREFRLYTLLGINNIFAAFGCETESALVLNNNGWNPIRDKTFNLFRDNNNRTFLQWKGNDEIRRELQQKLILIRLSCDNMCLAIRIGFVNFGASNSAFRLNQNHNYLIIGLCLGILGLIYVLSLILYIKLKKPQATVTEQPNEATNNEFLCRIREMISAAKSRIRNFRFHPTLLVIPEDDYFYHETTEPPQTQNPSQPIETEQNSLKSDITDDSLELNTCRATKGLSTLYKIKAEQWNHVCDKKSVVIPVNEFVTRIDV